MSKKRNEQIAKFLGYTQNISKGLWRKKGAKTLKKLNFDMDWNWIMHTVQKIESMEGFTKGEYFNVVFSGGTSVLIISSLGDEITTQGRGRSKFEAAYLAIVEFIDWYELKIKSCE